jgi:hypothetical protein
MTWSHSCYLIIHLHLIQKWTTDRPWDAYTSWSWCFHLRDKEIKEAVRTYVSHHYFYKMCQDRIQPLKTTRCCPELTTAQLNTVGLVSRLCSARQYAYATTTVQCKAKKINSVRQRVQILKILIMYSSPVHCYLMYIFNINCTTWPLTRIHLPTNLGESQKWTCYWYLLSHMWPGYFLGCSNNIKKRSYLVLLVVVLNLSDH